MTSTELARDLVDLLVAAGVEHLVLCPGSRSAPLAFASYDAAEAGRITLHTRIDERTAGFLALGLAKGSHRPAVVFCTSGTAAANLHPAVLEAAHAGVPLVVITADRPASMRGTGANQTTDQVGLFGEAAPSLDVVVLRRPGRGGRGRGTGARERAVRGAVGAGKRGPFTTGPWYMAASLGRFQ